MGLSAEAGQERRHHVHQACWCHPMVGNCRDDLAVLGWRSRLLQNILCGYFAQCKSRYNVVSKSKRVL